jgi:hypothetical protein
MLEGRRGLARRCPVAHCADAADNWLRPVAGTTIRIADHIASRRGRSCITTITTITMTII